MIEFGVCVIEKLPYSIRILLESAIRNCDEFQVKSKDVEKIIDWENTSPKQVEIPFKPARVLLQVSLLVHWSSKNFPFYLNSLSIFCRILPVYPLLLTLLA